MSIETDSYLLKLPKKPRKASIKHHCRPHWRFVVICSPSGTVDIEKNVELLRTHMGWHGNQLMLFEYNYTYVVIQILEVLIKSYNAFVELNKEINKLFNLGIEE